MMPMYADPILLRRQYANDKNLKIRQDIHSRYSVPFVQFPDWVLSRVLWHGDERILDVGCGAGNYYDRLRVLLPAIQYVGVDIEPGMLDNHAARHAPTGLRLSAADAQALPFPEGTFDVVMANHMLYHVPNVERALDECRRVLKPDGVLIAATNSANTMPEFNALYRRAIMLLSSPGKITSGSTAVPRSAFTLENGTILLARHFYAVVRHDLPGTLVFKDVDPVMDYLGSWRSMREAQLPAGVRWEDVMLIMREQFTRVIGHFGELIVNKLTGVLIASDRGGFINEYVAHLENHHHDEHRADE
jgi:SAM-dependent methyltransferase